MLTKHIDIMEDRTIVEFFLEGKYHLIEFNENHKKITHHKWKI